MAKSIFVCWSGGADSTYLIQRCIESDEYELVLGGYVVVRNNAAKAASELAAIEKLAPLLAESGKFAWLGALAEVNLVKSNPNLAFKQMPIWLFALVTALHPPVDEVAMGYHRGHGDDAAAHLDDLRAIWAAYRPLYHRDPPRLVFPLAEISKKDLLARLRPELRAFCVYCESPIGEDHRPCGKCRLCLNRALDESR